MNARGATTASLVPKLEQLGPLSEREQQVLAALPSEVQLVPAGQDLVREGERPAHCLLLLDGAAGRYRILGEDGRQIVAFRVAGGLIDLASLLLGRVDHSVAAVTPAHVLPVPHATILGWIERYPRLGWASALVPFRRRRRSRVSRPRWPGWNANSPRRGLATARESPI